MRKILLGLMCGLLIVGIANMGHAFLFFGKGGGGDHKSKASGTGLDVGALFNHDYHQFGVDPNKDERGSNDSVSNPIEDYLKLPGQGTNDFAWNRGDGDQNDFHFDSDRHDGRNGETGNIGQNNMPVPEPAMLLLLGMGLLGLAGYGRKIFKK